MRFPAVDTRLFVTFFAALIAAAPLFAAPDSSPVVTFERQAVVASGITPGGDVVFFAVYREAEGYSSFAGRYSSIVADDDRDGVVRFTMAEGKNVPRRSQWVIVDLTTGAFALAAGDGFVATRNEPDANSLRRSASGKLRRLELPATTAHVLWARPRTGAWFVKTGDGLATDEDGELNGKFALALERMAPLNASPQPPEEVVSGDLIVVLDPQDLSVTIVGESR